MADDVEITVPDLGESVLEVSVSKWLVKEGDWVEEDQPLVEVLSEKSDVEVPAPQKGRLVKKVVQESETAAKGAVLGYLSLEEKGEGEEEEPSQAKEGESFLDKDLAQGDASLQEEEKKPDPLSERFASMDVTDHVENLSDKFLQEESSSSQEEEKAPQVKPKATPLAKKIAAKEDLSLEQIQGSGVQGKIVKKDVIVESVPSPSVSPSTSQNSSQSNSSQSVSFLEAKFYVSRKDEGFFLQQMFQSFQALGKPLKGVNLGFVSESLNFFAPFLNVEGLNDALDFAHALSHLEYKTHKGLLTEKELISGGGLLSFLKPGVVRSHGLALFDDLKFSWSVSFFESQRRVKAKTFLIYDPLWLTPGVAMGVCEDLQKRLLK